MDLDYIGTFVNILLTHALHVTIARRMRLYLSFRWMRLTAEWGKCLEKLSDVSLVSALWGFGCFFSFLFLFLALGKRLHGRLTTRSREGGRGWVIRSSLSGLLLLFHCAFPSILFKRGYFGSESGMWRLSWRFNSRWCIVWIPHGCQDKKAARPSVK